jgi:adenine deaminase
VIADPHEIANVLGEGGISYMLDAARGLPLTIYYAMPSCVPATPVETAGAVVDAAAVASLMEQERMVALAEMMNFPGAIAADPEVLAKINAARQHGKPVDGHAPGLSGKGLNAYLLAGVSSDHESVFIDEALEKLRNGMHIMIREGTGAKNLEALLPMVTPATAHQIMWCTDDRHPHDICGKGHIDEMIRRAIKAGIDPVTAVRIGTLNPARYFRLGNRGAIAPGRRADMIVLSDLENFTVEQVYSGGVLAAQNGEMVLERASGTVAVPDAAMKVDVAALNFRIPAHGRRIRVIQLAPGQIITRSVVMEASVKDGLAEADASRDLAKLAVVERHQGTGNIGKGFVTGFGIQQGALASSVAHDSHNIIVVGIDDADMAAAVRTVVDMNGGLAAVADGRTLARLPLPIAGLMSMEPLEKVRDLLDEMLDATRRTGCRIPDPFMALSFLALPVIPELKLTDKGLFDVAAFTHVPLFFA